LGDGLTPSLTVMLANAEFWSFYCKNMVVRILKMITTGFLTAFWVHQIRF